MFYLGNDIVDNNPGFGASFSLYEKPHFVLAGEGLRLVDFPYRPPLSRRLWVTVGAPIAGLRLYRALALARVSWRVRSAQPAMARKEEEERAQWDRGLAITSRLLAELRSEVEASGARFVVALVPAPEAVDPEYRRTVAGRLASSGRVVHLERQPEVLEAKLLSILERLGVSTFSLTPPLRQVFVRESRPLFYYLDRHWNPEGHRVVADALMGYLVESGQLR
jgi:hypothetical protein